VQDLKDDIPKWLSRAKCYSHAFLPINKLKSTMFQLYLCE